jgi:hypothetical protein
MNLSALKKSKDQFKIYHSINFLKRMMCLTQTKPDGIERFCFWNQAQPILKC